MISKKLSAQKIHHFSRSAADVRFFSKQLGITCGHAFFSAPWEAPHMHVDFYELLVIVKGSGRQRVGENDFPFVRGDVFFIDTWKPHNIYQLNGELEFYYLLFQPQAFGFSGVFSGEFPGNGSDLLPIKFLFGKLQKFSFRREACSRIISLFSHACSEKKTHDQYSGPILFYLLNIIIHELARLGNAHPLEFKKEIPAMLLNAADLIREHCSEHIKMSDIARKAGVGISWLSRSFTRAFGCGPAAFLSVSRISKARKLLVTTEFNLTRIALECGFYDSAHFIKCFKKRTGSNPLDFRRRYCNVRVKQNVF